MRKLLISLKSNGGKNIYINASIKCICYIFVSNLIGWYLNDNPTKVYVWQF